MIDDHITCYEIEERVGQNHHREKQREKEREKNVINDLHFEEIDAKK